MEPYPNAQTEQGKIEPANEQESPLIDLETREKNDKQFQRGLMWLGAGVFLMVTSFVVNYVFFLSGTSFITVMYIFTGLGALCITKSLADMVGF